MPTWTRTLGITTGAVVALLVSSACQSTDRAGGDANPDATVLAFANPNEGAPPQQLQAWADRVEELSEAALRIEFTQGWRRGEAAYESGTISDVQAGKVDAAWVGARAFDTVGMRSFQALLAPLLVDSHALQRRVFEEGIPEEMLAGVQSLDLVGVGVLPGPMRKLLGKDRPYLAPADFRGDVIGLQASDVAARTFDALGATTTPLPTGADIRGVDGYEQQLASIAGNHYEQVAGHVTSNVNLWPRPLVLLVNRTTFDQLAVADREALTQAVTDAVLPALDASAEEDSDGAQALCEAGIRFAEASRSELAVLRRAVEPVYDVLEADPASSDWLARIEALKADLQAQPDSVRCDPSATTDQPTGSQPFPDGTYTQVQTPEDLRRACGPDASFDDPRWPDIPYDVELELQGGQARQWWTPTDRSLPRRIGWSGSYTIFRDRMRIVDGLDDMTATWSFDGRQLVISDLVYDSCGAVSAWTSHPWVLSQALTGAADPGQGTG